MNNAYAAQHPLNQLLAGVFECLEPSARGRRRQGRPEHHRDGGRWSDDDCGGRDRRSEHDHHRSRHSGHDGHRMDASQRDRRGRGDWGGDWPADLGWLFGGAGRGGPGFGGPGFGGPGFRGPGWGGPHHGRGPRRGRASRGDVRSAILILLDEEARNGYQIIQDIAERSHGMWRPSPGSVYPALSQLEDEGLITAEAEGSGRRYQLTEAGRAYVAEHRAELNAPWDAMAGERERQAEREPGVAQFAELMGQTGFAAVQVLRAGSSQQVEEARRLLEETRRGLYRILAEGDPAEDDTSYDDGDDTDDSDDAGDSRGADDADGTDDVDDDHPGGGS